MEVHYRAPESPTNPSQTVVRSLPLLRHRPPRRRRLLTMTEPVSSSLPADPHGPRPSGSLQMRRRPLRPSPWVLGTPLSLAHLLFPLLF